MEQRFSVSVLVVLLALLPLYSALGCKGHILKIVCVAHYLFLVCLAHFGAVSLVLLGVPSFFCVLALFSMRASSTIDTDGLNGGVANFSILYALSPILMFLIFFLEESFGVSRNDPAVTMVVIYTIYTIPAGLIMWMILFFISKNVFPAKS